MSYALLPYGRLGIEAALAFAAFAAFCVFAAPAQAGAEQAVADDSIVGVTARIAKQDVNVDSWRQRPARDAMKALWRRGFRCGISTTYGYPPSLLCSKDYPQALDCGSFFWDFPIQWHEASRDRLRWFRQLNSSAIERAVPECAGNTADQPLPALPQVTRMQIAQKITEMSGSGSDSEAAIERGQPENSGVAREQRDGAALPR